MSPRPIIAALGDSLTVGEHADGSPVRNHPWPALLDVGLFPYAGVGQFGLGGDTLVPSGGGPGMNTRWTAYIKGKGFAGRTLWGVVNDIIGDVSGATCAANAQALLLEMLAEGLTLFVLTPGFGAYSGWSPQRQAQFEIFRAAMFVFAAAHTTLLVLDLYLPYPAGLGDPSNPTAMLPAVRYSDGLHINPDPGATHVRDLVLAKLTPFFPPTFTGVVQVDTRNLQQLALSIRDFVTSFATQARLSNGVVAAAAVVADISKIQGVKGVTLNIPNVTDLTASQLSTLAAGLTFEGV